MNYLHILTILFIGLKLTNFITWSWWLVLLPSIASFGVLFVVFMIALAVAVQK